METVQSRIWTLLLVSLVLPWPLTCAQEQPIIRCKSDKATKGHLTYKVGLKFRTVPKPGIGSSAGVQVYVKPEHINREDLVKLASEFKQDFCKEPDLLVSLFTDRRYIDVPVIRGLWGYQGGYESAANAIRGFYYLNRNTGEEYISFSSVPNYDKNQESRTRIDLRKD